MSYGLLSSSDKECSKCPSGKGTQQQDPNKNECQDCYTDCSDCHYAAN